jgi:hypothetical protein
VRTLAITAVFLLAPLAGCIHLPAEVAAVVRESDPPGLNNFRRVPPPEQAVSHAGPLP